MQGKGMMVIGTDTDVGKTIVTGLLARYLLEKGHSVITQKWIQTGCSSFPHDITEHLRLMKRKKDVIREYLAYTSPYVLKFPASPHLSACLEKGKINETKIKQSFEYLSSIFSFVIVEGIGGALVPFNQKRFVIDIATELKLPVLIVAQNRLGAINHTLLTIEAIRRRKMKIIGIIFNSSSKKERGVILKDNMRIVRRLTGENILGELPWLKDKGLLYSSFIPIGDRILNG